MCIQDRRSPVSLRDIIRNKIIIVITYIYCYSLQHSNVTISYTHSSVGYDIKVNEKSETCLMLFHGCPARPLRPYLGHCNLFANSLPLNPILSKKKLDNMFTRLSNKGNHFIKDGDASH